MFVSQIHNPPPTPFFGQMAQTTEQGLFSAGNSSGTRERNVHPIGTRSFQGGKTFRKLDLTTQGAATNEINQVDCGKIVLLDMAGQNGVQTLTFPSAVNCAGQTIEVILETSSASGGNLVITFTGGCRGAFILNAAASLSTVASDGSDTTLTMILPVLGTHLSATSNGSYWIVSGMATATASGTAFS